MTRNITQNVVQLEDSRLATKNLVPGRRVYDEDLVNLRGEEFRTWNPTRSKLAAYILKGGQSMPFHGQSRVLYLGAANGTTPSHVSDIASRGIVWGLEFSPRSFRDLVGVSEPRRNMVPMLGDAWRPDEYRRYVGNVEILYQDIAQRHQAAIFARNLKVFAPQWGFFMVKARSVDVAADPRAVYDDVTRAVEKETGYNRIEMVDLGPYERDHACLVFRPGRGGGGGAPDGERARPDRHRGDRRGR
jgi:fibrillarin-like pre-rRNA processing protein